MIDVLSGNPVVFATIAFLFALLIGSFLNVVVYRLPVMMERSWREEANEILSSPAEDLPEGRFDLVLPRSRCPHCGNPISALQNVPVLSYLLLKGKCKHCKAGISIRYPIVEFVTALLSAVVAWRFGFGPEAALALAVTWALVAITLIDADHQLIPDSLVLPLLWLALAASLLHPLPDAMVLFVSPREAIIGAMAGYLSLWSVYQGFRLLTGKEGMGYGDFKLLAALGALLGWQALPLIIILSAVVGAVVGLSMIAIRGHDRNVPIPFGPYLAAAGFISMLHGPELTRWYLGLF